MTKAYVNTAYMNPTYCNPGGIEAIRVQQVVQAPAAFLNTLLLTRDQALSGIKEIILKEPLASVLSSPPSSKAALFQIQWQFDFQVKWDPAFGPDNKQPLQLRWYLLNHGSLELVPLSEFESCLKVRLSYERLADDALWQALMELFPQPQQWVEKDLKRMADQLERLYIESLAYRTPLLQPAIEGLVPSAA